MKIKIRRRNLLKAVLSVFLMFTGCTGTSENTAEKTEEKTKPALEVIDDDSGDLFREAEQKLQVQEETKAELFQISEVNTEKKDYTVMVYIIGSDLESRGGQATKDIEEMRRSGLDYENTNLVLYTGGARRWVSDIPNDKNCVIDMKNGETVDIIASTESTADMGSPETLREFLNFCTENYPAEHYGLILWDHGGGPLWGYGSDQLFGNDSLILNELKKAMDQTEFGKEKKLDFVGFDACLMGTAENANLWKNYADYFVASEELEPGGGWDYSFLSILNETDDTEKIITEIVDSYGRSIENARSEYFNPEYTLSAMDLSKTEEMVNAVNELSLRMSEEIEEGRYSYLRKIRGNAREFGRGHSYDLVDLCHFAEQLSERYPEEAEAVRHAVNEMTVAKTGNIEEAEGLSLYLPAENRELLEAAGKFMDENTDLSETYRNFMDAYEEKWLSGGREDWMLADPVLEGDEITLQLTEEQAAGSEITVTYLFRTGNLNYVQAMCKVHVEADENGIVRIPSDPYLISMETEKGTLRFPVRCKETAYSEKGYEYQTFSTYAFYGMEIQSDLINFDGELVTFLLHRDEGGSECVIRDIVTETSSVTLDGKGSVDISNYESIGAYCFGYRVRTDEQGKTLPFTEWKYVNMDDMWTLPADEGICFRMRRASEFHKDFICQVLLKDSSGNQYAADYIELPQVLNENRIQRETENGVLTFDLYDDHAELVDYDGTDTKLVIPDEIDGKAVTVFCESALAGGTFEELVLPSGLKEIKPYALNFCPNMKTAELPEGLKEIDDYAFRSCSGLTDIIIPDGVERIGRGAFYRCDLISVTLPEKLKEIGKIPFLYNENMKEIKISGDNESYKTDDGVLFSKDGSVLIQYPPGRGDSYTVPEGTTRIDYGAFAVRYSVHVEGDTEPIKNVTFPDSLEEIGNMAFYNCGSLTEIRLPEKLRRIGDYAFGTFYYLGDMTSEGTIQEIHIPAGVEYIGARAFSCVKTSSFTVDEKNPYYASAGGFITNKHKDTILMRPPEIGKVIRIPEGITTLTEYVFWDADREADFIIPDSVFRFSEEAFPSSVDTETNEKIYKITIHCSEGSAAEEYAERYNIPYETDYDSVISGYQTIVVPAGEADLVFHVYADHAELVSTEGEDEKLIIPGMVQGVPVTRLRQTGDYSAGTGRHNFEQIEIPASVTTIDRGFLQEISAAEYTAAAGNTAFSTVDGVLFDRTGTTLIRYPKYREGKNYTVPEGTERIGTYAFEPYVLEEVTIASTVKEIDKHAFRFITAVHFSEGLEKIGDNAFSGCRDLNEVFLPESLQEIGSRAFEFSGEEAPVIHMPPHLKTTGESAVVSRGISGEIEEVILDDLEQAKFPIFEGFTIGSYRVADDNPYFCTVQGMLFSKDRRTLYAVPSAWEGECRIPEGTARIDSYAFNDCIYITDLYVPSSVKNSAGAIPINTETQDTAYTVHCPSGSDTARELEEKQLSWTVWDE